MNFIDRAWYGCRRDARDALDFLKAARRGPVPSHVDLRHLAPPVMDQGPIGSCVAHAVTSAARYHIIRRNTTYDFEMSRLQLYHDTRAMEGTVKSDGGCEIRNAIKTLAKRGVGHEELWPYDTERFADAPPQEVYDDAPQYKALRYERVTVATDAVKQVLAYGTPVIIGITLYDSFESDEVARGGVVPVPNLDKERSVGGHCMIAYGYEHKHFIVRNSWATDWGDKGDCYIPEAIVGSTRFGADYWDLMMFGSDAEMRAGRA